MPCRSTTDTAPPNAWPTSTPRPETSICNGPASPEANVRCPVALAVPIPLALMLTIATAATVVSRRVACLQFMVLLLPCPVRGIRPSVC